MPPHKKYLLHPKEQLELEGWELQEGCAVILIWLTPLGDQKYSLDRYSLINFLLDFLGPRSYNWMYFYSAMIFALLHTSHILLSLYVLYMPLKRQCINFSPEVLWLWTFPLTLTGISQVRLPTMWIFEGLFRAVVLITTLWTHVAICACRDIGDHFYSQSLASWSKVYMCHMGTELQWGV